MFDASDTGKARLWDLGRKKTVRCFCPSPKEDNADIASVCHGENDFSDLVAVAYNTSVALFDVREPALVARKAAMSFHLHQDEVNHVAMSSLHGRTHLAAADDNGELLFYDLSAGKLLQNPNSGQETGDLGRDLHGRIHELAIISLVQRHTDNLPILIRMICEKTRASVFKFPFYSSLNLDSTHFLRF